MKRRKTYEQFKEEFYKVQTEDENYTLLSTTYTNNRTKVLVRHEDCGFEYEVTPDKFLMGRRCPNHKTKTTSQYKKEVFDLVGDEYLVLGEYMNKTTPVKMKHTTCGRIYSTAPATFLKGHRCASCSKDKKTNDEFILEVKELVGDEYIFLEEYNTNKVPILVKHSCGHTYKVSPSNFLFGGYRCPKCSIDINRKGKSKTENELYKYIKSIYKGKIKRNYRLPDTDTPISKSKEIDIFIPEYNIGIEYDGLYWHSEKIVGKNYHIDKTLYFKEHGIRIIHVFADEWSQKKDIVKAKLRNILKLSNSSIGARKLKIKNIESSVAREFLNTYHIQGADNSSIRLGAYFGEELVAVMTFSKLRRSLGSKSSNENEYELVRFASSTRITGGFSKMLKYAINVYNFEKIKTFADLRWSDFDNNVYTKNGFTLTHISKPGYFYVPNSGRDRLHRYNFRKQVLKEKFPDVYDEALTEFQIMDRAKYNRIWDCGNLVYEYNIKR